MHESLEDSLEKFLCREFRDGEQEQESFVIDTEEKADWAIRKILRCQHKVETVKQFSAVQINEINHWKEQQTEENERSINYLISLLEPYAKSQLDGKKKTVKMPSGNISFRAVLPEYVIAGNKVDGKNQQLLDHIRQSDPDYLKIEESVNWTDFKNSLTLTSTGQVITADGEILGFMSAVEHPDSVSVKERK